MPALAFYAVKTMSLMLMLAGIVAGIEALPSLCIRHCVLYLRECAYCEFEDDDELDELVAPAPAATD